ncbi:sulfur oxidation c-type cytochrome SoxX [Elioraea thermophila]|uniref:sulfur oxidation c-type cytochrome SoxX n=1 Tax=Elioraea thermophila TaxID=2185104 RepID=UPI000DF442CA|nr:sulfur oxidation c-type cytochrome SoxX [Elioraea thermophila]
MRRYLLSACILGLLAGSALAERPRDLPEISAERLEQAIRSSFDYDRLPPDLKARLEQDEVQRLCSQYRNEPPADVAERIQKLSEEAVVFPSDGKFLGDWRRGEQLSLAGQGLRMRDDPRRGVGGNCYACHQMAPQEVAYGTLGPSLLQYGKIRDYDAEAIRTAYIKIYNSNATLACSTMPRYGTQKILSIEDITHILAFLFDPESPVNKE